MTQQPMPNLHPGGATGLAEEVERAAEPPEPRPGHLVVLLVEDDALIRMDAAEMLRELGHEVLEVEYGPDALAALQGRHVDVLVTDVGLPGMSGIELARRVRQLRPGIGLIFATGDTELEGKEACRDAVFLCKPYDAASLARSVHRTLTGRQEQSGCRCPGSPRP
ncbi:MAG: response regulator [Frateuria sp.]|nr:response regulator [Frateuria sp.]